MGWRGLFEGWHLVVLIVLVIVIFGWKRLPDAARSLGRSLRIFKSEVEEMKHDPKPSAASRDTVHGETVNTPRETPHTPPPAPSAAPGATGGVPTPPHQGQPAQTGHTGYQDPTADPAPPQDQAGSAQDSRLT